MERLTLGVNGEAREVTCDPAVPLIYVLRNELGLKGAKLGCALEQCGACTVLVDGESVQSCVRAASEFVDSEIVTVEALERDRVGAAVQRAFVAEGAAQCGYCTTGMVVAATALLKKTPAPARNALAEALHGHLCRCGSQARVLAAVDRACREIRDAV